MYSIENEMEYRDWGRTALEEEEREHTEEIERDIRQLQDVIGYLEKYAKERDYRSLLMKQHKDLHPSMMRLFDLIHDIKGNN